MDKNLSIWVVNTNKLYEILSKIEKIVNKLEIMELHFIYILKFKNEYLNSY